MWPLIGRHSLIILITVGTLKITLGYHVAVDTQPTFNYNGHVVRMKFIDMDDGHIHFSTPHALLVFAHTAHTHTIHLFTFHPNDLCTPTAIYRYDYILLDRRISSIHRAISSALLQIALPSTEPNFRFCFEWPASHRIGFGIMNECVESGNQSDRTKEGKLRWKLTKYDCFSSAWIMANAHIVYRCYR